MSEARMSKLDEIESYLSKMTAAPWRIDQSKPGFVFGGIPDISVDPRVAYVYGQFADKTDSQRDANAHGITSLRQDAEYLVRRCRELEKALRLITSCTNRDALLIAVAEAERILKGGE